MSLHRNLRGADLHAPSQELVENNTGSTLTKLKVVSLNGMGAVYPQVQPTDPTLRSAFGIVLDDIVTGKSGYITTLGFMFNVDTSAWPVNTILYADASGSLTTTQPVAPNNTPVAFSVRQDTTSGILYVTALTDTIMPQSASWFITGNSGLNDTSNFIGTVDAIDFNIRTNNLLRAKFNATSGLTMFTTMDLNGNYVENLLISGEAKHIEPDDTHTDISTLLRFSSPMGLLTLGGIEPTGGLTVNVEAGIGYLQKSDGSLRKIMWPDTPLTLPANATRYLYFDEDAVLQTSILIPNNTENVVIGRVVTSATDILLTDESGPFATHGATKVGDALRYGLGAVYSDGSVASEFGTRMLSLTAGSYYYGERHFLSLGGSPITFTTFYQDGTGGFVDVPGQTVVSNTEWDNGTGTLAPLTAGYFAKHAIYVLGDSSGDHDNDAYFLVYSQAQYTALTLAEQGSLPNPPNYLSEAVALVASIIVQEGVTNIVEVRDERPLFFSKRVSSIAATTFHHNLQGLNDFDDHLRYLPTDGSRPMTGDLPMGGFNVTNAGTYNGVVVENHHARHQPGSGLDELPTGPGFTLHPDVAGATGTSTSLSRADHNHLVPTATAIGLNGASSSTQGVSTSFSRADHSHFIAKGAPSAQTPDQANATGTSTNFALADHIHNIPTAAPLTTLSPATTNDQGTAATFARSDHSHMVATALAGDITTIQPDDSASAGTANTFARGDHRHAIAAGTVISQTPDNANAEGVSTSFARADHVHNVPTAIASGLNANSTNTQGVAATFSRSDHTHAIASGVVIGQTPNQVNAAGTSTNFARADHVHNIPTQAPATQSPDAGNTDGAAAFFSRSDHGHNIPTAAPTTTLSPATTNSQGAAATFSRSDHGHAVATALVGDITTIQPDDSASAGTANTFARGDHRHAIAAGVVIGQTPDQSNAEGTSTSFARADHVHNIPTAVASGLNANSTSTQGSAATFARSDHTHAIASGVVIGQTPDQANAAGTSTNFARADHVHNIPTAVASTISTNANAQGAAATFARADHTHQLTAGAASQDHIPEYDGSNWQATYPEAFLNAGRAWMIYDEWVSASSSGQLGWTSVVTGGSSATTVTSTGTDANHPGVVVITAGNAAARFATVHLGLSVHELGGGALTIECLFQLQTLTNAAFRIGLGDQTAADHNNGVYLEYNSSVSANWLLKTANGGTRTSTTTTTAATASVWHKLVITVNAAATSVSYTLDGVSLGSVTTNIPTTNAISPNLMSDSLSNTNSTMWVDYYKLYQRFTSAR